jgi:hypothetical protein
MPMLKKIAFATALASASFTAAPAFAADSPAVGSWDIVADTQMGQFESTMIVADSGDGYTVDIEDKPMTGPGGSAMPAMPSTISDVKVDGANFSFKRTIDFQGQALVLSYTGSVEGDTLTATANSDFGPTPVTGKRSGS